METVNSSVLYGPTQSNAPGRVRGGIDSPEGAVRLTVGDESVIPDASFLSPELGRPAQRSPAEVALNGRGMCTQLTET